jgi:hypothetical protein
MTRQPCAIGYAHPGALAPVFTPASYDRGFG